MSHMSEPCKISTNHVTHSLAECSRQLHIFLDTESCHITHEWGMSHMNESCHIWMRHVTYECVMSHMNASCHIWMRHVTYECVMSHMNESCHIWTSHVTYERVMSHMNESCHIWIRHVTYEYVMSHVNQRGTRANSRSSLTLRPTTMRGASTVLESCASQNYPSLSPPAKGRNTQKISSLATDLLCNYVTINVQLTFENMCPISPSAAVLEGGWARRVAHSTAHASNYQVEFFSNVSQLN